MASNQDFEEPFTWVSLPANGYWWGCDGTLNSFWILASVGYDDLVSYRLCRCRPRETVHHACPLYTFSLQAFVLLSANCWRSLSNKALAAIAFPNPIATTRRPSDLDRCSFVSGKQNARSICASRPGRLLSLKQPSSRACLTEFSTAIAAVVPSSYACLPS